MSTGRDLLDDEYVAQLLAEDAKNTSIRYSSVGLSALLPKRPTTAAPRPNTRFLNSIIREADSHNAALKRKEELEARIRLRKIQEHTVGHHSAGFTNSARLQKRRRLSDGGDEQRHRHSDQQAAHRTKSTSSRSTHSSRQARDGNDGSSGILPSEGDRARSQSHRRDRRGERYRSRSPSSNIGDSEQLHRDRDSRKEHRKRHRRRFHLQVSDSEHEPGRLSHGRNASSVKRTSKRQMTPTAVDAEDAPGVDSSEPSRRSGMGRTSRSRSASSDPLEIIVGPLPSAIDVRVVMEPPLRSRGRGAYRTATSAMDAHFSADYDPHLDLRPDSEVDEEKEDWDMALEALKDREMWKRKHADRLREAGFDDDAIKKWESSGQEKNGEDVRWSKSGEAREWDRGKVSQEEELDRRRLAGEKSGWTKTGGFVRSFKAAIG